jgi:hypothetical protein
LLSNAEYEARGLSEVVGFKPQESLYELAEPMLRALASHDIPDAMVGR